MTPFLDAIHCRGQLHAVNMKGYVVKCDVPRSPAPRGRAGHALPDNRHGGLGVHEVAGRIVGDLLQVLRVHDPPNGIKSTVYKTTFRTAGESIAIEQKSTNQ